LVPRYYFETTRRIRLSEAGELYYQHCRGLPEALSSAEEVISTLNQAPIGLFKMTCATTFGERYIAPLMNDFLLDHPKIELDFHLTNRAVDIIDEGYDLCYSHGCDERFEAIYHAVCVIVLNIFALHATTSTNTVCHIRFAET